MKIADHPLLKAHPHKVPRTIQDESPPMLGVFATVTAKPGRAEELKEALAIACSLVRANEPDVLQFHAMQSREDPHVFKMFEVYRDQAALEHHISGTPYMAALLPLMRDPLVAEPNLEWVDSIFD